MPFTREGSQVQSLSRPPRTHRNCHKSMTWFCSKRAPVRSFRAERRKNLNPNLCCRFVGRWSPPVSYHLGAPGGRLRMDVIARDGQAARGNVASEVFNSRIPLNRSVRTVFKNPSHPSPVLWCKRRKAPKRLNGTDALSNANSAAPIRYPNSTGRFAEAMIAGLRRSLTRRPSKRSR